MAVPPPAPAAFCGNKGLRGRHICHDSSTCHLTDNGAAGDADNKVFACFARAPSRFAICTVWGGVFAFVLKVGECCQVFINLKHNIAALAAIPAFGAAGCDIFFTAESYLAISAAACLYLDFCLVYKHFFSFASCTLS